jgi:hypothetical protein
MEGSAGPAFQLSSFVLLSAIAVAKGEASAKADHPFSNFPLQNVKEHGRLSVSTI